MKNKIGIYPGSFNPLHEGHLKILEKALLLFDFIYVIVTYNPDKDNAEDIEERYQEVKTKLKSFENVEVILNKNKLTGDVAKELGVRFIIRSGRSNEDFKYELELAAGNNKVNPELETILIIPHYDDIKYSSTLLRHIKKLKEQQDV